MRKDIKMLCVTNWGAVLELKGAYAFGFISVADPYSIDSGHIISKEEIILVAKVKTRK